jgi:TatD DNase family protein
MAMKPLKENWKRDIQDFLDLGGKKILTQGTDIEDFCETLDLADEINSHFHIKIVDTALGIHPTVFKEKFHMENPDQIYESSKKFVHRFQEIFEKEKSKLNAIGETGLDYFEMYNNGVSQEKIQVLKEIQKESFSSHVLLAKDNQLPLSIHAREREGESSCVQDALEIVAKKGNGLVKGVFHSYTGDIEKLPDILDLGFGIGFNAIITYPSGESVREILKKTPLDRIFFETDGPFLPTQSIRRDKKAIVRYGRSAQVREIMEVAAEIKNIPVEKLEIIIDENYERVFG